MGRKSSTPRPGGRIKESSLPAKLKDALNAAGVKTFKAVSNLHSGVLLQILAQEGCRPYDIEQLSIALVDRGLPKIEGYHKLESGEGALPADILEKLYEAKIFTADSVWCSNRTTIAAVVGDEAVDTVTYYLASAFKMDAVLSIYWYTDRGFPTEGADALWHQQIKDLRGLFDPAWGHLEAFATGRPGRRSTKSRDDAILYGRWWFRKNYPDLAQYLTST